MSTRSPKIILPIIVACQFFCTSLWFAGNGIMEDLISSFNLDGSSLGHLTTAVQLGFIIGTLTFAVLTIADRFSPAKVFFVSALLGALVNLGVVWDGNSFGTLVALRFFTGFFLAGIYPVGMKIAADYFDTGLGRSLGYLVGALVLGTALPHLLRDLVSGLPWTYVIVCTSILASLGGLLMMLLVPNGPFRKASRTLQLRAFATVFKNTKFRSAAFGYFGHMWELYAFWAFVPVILSTYQSLHESADFNLSVLSFLVIAIGGLGCVLGGYLSERLGVKRVALFSLSVSGLCCLVSPFLFQTENEILFLGFLLVWGVVVITDSPLFSTMVAHNARSELKGTALTIVNCIGFAITIVSIQLVSWLSSEIPTTYLFLFLAFGPLVGLLVQKRSP